MIAGQPLGIAFLGCGAVTRAHTRTLRSIDRDLRLYYASRELSRASEMNTWLQRSRRVRLVRRRTGGPSVWTRCSSPRRRPFHLEWTLRALAAGKHVIVEKPPFSRATDFEPVETAARIASRQVMVAENYFYKPIVRALRSMIRGGAIGEPRFLDIKALKTQPTQNWRDDAALAVGGALYEGGIHWIDFIANLGLDLISIQGFRPGRGTGLDREMLVVARYAQGAVGALFFSWNTPSAAQGRSPIADSRHRGLDHVRVERALRAGAWQADAAATPGRARSHRLPCHVSRLPRRAPAESRT